MSQRVEALGAIHGETQRFECQVIGYPTPTVTWFKDEIDISENVRYQIDYNQEQGVIALIIRNVTLADEGLYLCKAENSEGHATTTAYLVVKVDPSSGSAKDYSSMTIEKVSEEEHSQVEVLKSGRQTIIEEVITRVEESEREEIEEKSVAPKIIYDPVFAQDLSLKVGATIAFEVNVRGYPRPSVAWFVGNTQLEESSRVSVEVKEGASSLKVRSVTGEDAGTYKVMAENALGLDTATFKVIVKAPPSPPQNLHVIEVFKDYVVVSWEPPKYDGGEKLSGYEVEKSLDGMIFVSAGYVDSSVLRHKIIRLQEGFEYIFRVSAENRIGLGDPATLDKPVTCKLPFDPPGQPRNLTVKEYSKDFIAIVWNEPEGNGGSEIIQYVVEKCDVTRGGHTWVVAGTVGPSEKTFRASRLFQGNLYLFRVVAENQAGPGPAVELTEPVMAKLPFDTPGAPTNVRVKDYWSDSITIAWDAPEHDGGSPITSYLIEQRDALHPKWIKAASLEADVLLYKAGNLFEGTDYTFQVFASNKLGPGTEAGQLERPCKAKMPFDPPFAPAHLEATDYGTNHVTLSWSAPDHDGGSPIVGYIIERHDTLVGTWTQVAKATTDVLKATVAGLFEGQSYNFRVAAVNQCGQGLYTEIAKPVTTLLPYSKPSKPQNLKVLNIWRDYAMIGWDEPSDDGGCPLTGFTIEQRDADEIGFKFVAAVGENVTQHQVTNLLQGHEYYFRVFAQNSMGLSDQAAELWSPVKTSLPCELPSAPLNVHVTETGNGLISIAWQAPKTDGGAPISGYLVETCLSVSTNWRRAGLVDGNTMAFNLTGLVEGDYYFVRVYSENEAGRSRRAAEILEPVRAKQPSKVPGPPTNLRATETTASTITVSWDMPKFDGVSDATQYIIDARESDDAEYAAAGRVDGRINYFTLENLDKGKQYFFRVRSKNSAGFCETSAELSSPVQPKDSTATPLPPESFQVSEMTDSSLKLSWTSTQKPTRYVIEQRDGLDGPFFLSATPEGSTTSFVMESLIPNQLYSFRIWAEVEGRRSETCAQVSTKQSSTKRTAAKDEVDFGDESEIVRKMESGFELSESLVEKAEVRKAEQLEVGTMEQVDPILEPVHLSKIKQVEQAEVTQVEPAEKQDFDKKQEKQEDVETREEEQAKSRQAGQEELQPAEQVEQTDVKQLEQTEAKKVQQTEASVVEQAEIKQVEQVEVEQEREAEVRHAVQAAVEQVDKPDIEQVEQAEVKPSETDEVVEVKQTEAKQAEKAEVEELEQDRAKEGKGKKKKKKAKEVETIEAEEVVQAKVKHVEQVEVEKVEQKVSETVEVEHTEIERVERTEVKQVEHTEVKQVEQKEVKQIEETEVKQLEQNGVKQVEQKEVKQIEESEVKQVEQAEVQPCERIEQTETIQVEQKEVVPVEIKSKEETEVRGEEQEKVDDVEQSEVKPEEQTDTKHTEQTAIKPETKQPEDVTTPVEQNVKLEKLKSIEQETEEESSEEEYFEDAVVDTESEVADSFSHETSLATGTSNEAQTLAVGKSESVPTEAALKEELLMENKTNLTEELSEGIIEKEEAARSDATQVKQEAEVKVTTEGSSTSVTEQIGSNKDVKTEQAKEPAFEKEITSAEEHVSLQKLPTQFSNLSAQQLTSESIVLNWEPPKDTGGVDVLSYIIVMRDSGKSKYKKVGQVVGSSLTYEVSNLKEGHEYWFRIFAENSFGISKEFADMEAAVKMEKKKKEKKSKEKLVVESGEVNKEEKETVVSEEVEEVTVTTTTTTVETIVEEVSQTSAEKVAAWLGTGRVTNDDAPLFDSTPETVLVKEGETIRLPCRTKGQPPPEVKFYKGEERLKPRKKDKKLRLSYDVTDDLFVLEISNATVEDAGVYHIKAVNKIGSTEAQVVVKVTSEAVKSDTLSGSVSEIVTDEISALEGEIKDHGKHVSTLEGEAETSNVLESSQTVVETSDLTQTTVKEDASVLKSQLVTEELLDLETSFSTTSTTVTKTFKQTDVKEELVVEKKSTSEVSSELNVEQKVVSEVTDNSVKEDEKHKAGTERDVKDGTDEQTEVSEQPSSVEVKQNVEKADNKIVKVTKEDQLLKNDSGAEKKKDEKADKAIDVEYTEEDVAAHLPVFEVKPEPVAVNEGETVRLTWKISQDSKADFGWTKNGKKLKVRKDKRVKVGFDATTGSGFLEIVGADLNDIGEYSLNVENEHGRIIQVVFVNVVSKSEGKPPKLEEYPKPQIVSEGQAFEVSCQVSGEPSPEVEFLKNGRPVDIMDSRVTVSRADKTCRLHVTDAVPGDSGKYTVTATNERGKTSHTVSVDVQGTERSFAEKQSSPEFLTKLVPLKASEGEAVKLSIAIKDSEDTNVSWFKDGSPLISDGNLKIGREENIYFLEIKGSTVEDSGEYTCTANNVGGVSFCTASVEVSAPPVDIEVSQQVQEKDADLISFETGKEKVDKDELDSSSNTRKDSQTESQKDSEKDGQKDGQSSDEEMEDDVEKSYPQYVAVTKYTSTDGQGLDVEEDEIIEVLNSKGSEMWLCRKPENPEKHGWVPARFLIAKSEATKLDTRSTQEVFRDDVIKITNKQQEAIMKRRYALKDLWESERDYVRDLNFTMESYHNPFQVKTPDVFAGRTDILFSSLPSLLSFHDKFLDEIMNCSNDPDSLANCFLSAEQSFQLYIPYLKTRQEADQILVKEDVVKFLKEHDVAIGNVGEQKLSLPHYLQRPSNRLHEYTSTLKDFMRYSVRANQNTAQLERAVVMLESLRKKADDQLLVDHITNYDGALAELGPVLCHENFTVWRGEATGKGKDCHIFLFKDKLLITRKRKSDTPTYECKTVINLQDVLINELGDRRFELCFEELSRGKYTIQSKLAPVSDAWCQLLATLISKWGRKPEFRTKVDDITCKEGAPIHITALVYGQPLPDVSWYFDGQPIIPKGDYKIMSDGCQQTLAISSVVVSMSGRYSAKAKNSHGEEELSVTVTVEEDLIEPKFTSELRKCDVLLGADAKFSVKISGKPLPTVKWFKDGVELAESPRLKLLPVDSQTQILILTQVEESDIGVYECRAETKAGATSSKAKLNITDLEERKLEQAPEFITALRDTLAIEGNETHLNVTFSGRPLPEVKWFYNGKDLTASNEITQAYDGQSASLTIKSTRPEHSGRYSCCLSNRFGSVEVASVLSVASPPLLTGDFGNQERNCGETASFVCSFKSLPRPDVTWCRNGQELSESDRISIEITDSLTTLTISNVEPSDEGDYSCHLVNAAGETICSAKLACLLKQHSEVDGSRIESRRPVFLKAIENQEVAAGGLAKFCCEATGHPFTSIKWFKDREELRSTDRIQMEAKDGVAWISISDVRDTDAGCYQCTLSNTDGQTSSTALLNVQSLNIDLDEVAEKKLKESKLLNVVPVMPFDKPLLKEIDLNTLEISWLPATLPPTAHQTPISYVLERKDLGDVTSSWIQIRSGLAETVFHLIDYSPTKDFLYRVYAENQFGSSDPTLSVTYYGKSASEMKASKPVYRECLPPKTPKDKPTIAELKDDALKISWQASELPAGAAITEIWYIVERRCPPSKNWIEIASEIKDTEYEMHDYRPEKDYMFRIRAGNEYGMSEPSMSATLFTKPPESSKSVRKKDSDEYKSKVKPRTIWDKPEIADMIGTALTLRWKPSSIPPYAVQTKIWYIVEQRIPPDTDWTKIATDLSDTEMRIKYSATNDYYFRVRAANEFGIAEPSMPVMLRKKEDVLESEAEMLAKKKKEKAERDYLSSRRVPDHMRIIPEFLGTPEDTQYGVEGRTSEVVLRLRAYPEPKVTWNFHNTRIEMGGKYTSSLSSSGELVLQIHDFSWSEVGEYKVIIENEFGAATRTIKIDMADPPTFLEPMKDQIFNLHQSGRLECRVHGIPYPTIQFKKDWRPVAGSHRIKLSREDFDHWSLNIQNSIRTDEGVYECIAENVAGKVYCTANVKIAEKSGLRRDIKFNGVATEEYFHVIDELGRGSYGVVRRVIDKNSGSQYAAKFLRYNDPLVREELAQELEMMSLLDHNNIVQVVDGYEDKKRLVVVMEIVTGGELFQRLVSEDSLMESEAAFYLRQLLLAVEYMHAQNVIHLDLKPENLLLSSSSSDELKVIDFGFARRYNPKRKLRVKYASPEFCSPEVARDESITPATDLWSVGVIAYILLTGVSPFHAESPRQTLLKIQAGKVEFPSEIFAEISEVAQEFISKLLEKDPRRRMSATEAIKHPFLCLANHRGLGNRIGMDRHRAYMFRRKWERGSTVVRTIVQPKPLSAYMIEAPAVEVDMAVPVLHMPGGDESDRASLSGSIQLEAGASAMLQIMGPPSMMSATPSVAGSGSSSEWGREYEDEDTWYEFSSAYQTGPDTHLFPSKDTGLSLRMAKYRRTSHSSASASRTSSVRSLKERRDLRDLDKELDMEDPMPSRFATRGSWQQKNMMMSSSEGYPPIFKEKIHDKAYCVGDPCTLKVRVIGNPQPIISWYRNDELLTEGGRVRVTYSDDGRHSLTILQTKPNDFGVYKSVARNKYGTVTCRARMLCGDHPSRPGRPHVTKISDRETFMIWEEPESDGNSYIHAYKVDWHRPGDERWSTATYCIDECALIKRLRPDTSYRFRVSAINKFGPSPYSWASVEIRTKKKGASSLDVDSETKRILLRSRQATSRPSPEASPSASPFGSTEDIVQAVAEEKARQSGLPCTEVHLQEADPRKHLQFGSEIWRGRFSIVLNVQPKEGVKIKRVAKVSEFDPANPERSLQEYEVLKSVRQEHVVRLYEAFLWDSFVVLVFEKLYGENVVRSLSLKNRYSEYIVTNIIKQVLDALQFLHHHGMVHLNIQPDNVIMQSRRRFDVKLVDFGQAHRVTTPDGVKVSRIGTAEFMAPEKVTSENVGVAGDVWGVGVLAFILLSGISPFYAETDDETFSNIELVRYDAHALYHNVTKFGLKFLFQTLRRNPKSRLTVEECLDHRWLMLNQVMVKSRRSAVFSTDKLKFFLDDYITRRMRNAHPPKRLVETYGSSEESLWPVSDDDDEPFFAVNIGAAAKNMF